MQCSDQCNLINTRKRLPTYRSGLNSVSHVTVTLLSLLCWLGLLTVNNGIRKKKTFVTLEILDCTFDNDTSKHRSSVEFKNPSNVLHLKARPAFRVP